MDSEGPDQVCALAQHDQSLNSPFTEFFDFHSLHCLLRSV